MKHCKLQNVFRSEKIKKEKVKMKTQNEKIVETDIYIHGIIQIKNSYYCQEETVQCK